MNNIESINSYEAKLIKLVERETTIIDRILEKQRVHNEESDYQCSSCPLMKEMELRIKKSVGKLKAMKKLRVQVAIINEKLQWLKSE